MASRRHEYCGSHVPQSVDCHDKFECEYCHTFITNAKIKKHKNVCPCRPKFKEYVTNNINTCARSAVPAGVLIDPMDLFCIFDDPFPKLKIFDIDTTTPSDLFKSNIQEYILSRILQQYVEESLLSSNFGLIDFGSGKAELLHYCRIALKELSNVTYIAVDMKTFKFKFDRMFKFNELEGNHKCDLKSCTFRRLQADVKDLDINNVKELNNIELVGTCKHLCGSATDLGLNCLLNQKSKLFLFAPCCHHRTTSSSFLYDDRDLPKDKLTIFKKTFAEKYALSDNINEMFLQILPSIAKLSSWATIKPNERDANKIEMGRKVKYFLDELRGKYVERQGYKVEHAIYCDISVTPENRIMACKRINGI